MSNRNKTSIKTETKTKTKNTARRVAQNTLKQLLEDKSGKFNMKTKFKINKIRKEWDPGMNKENTLNLATDLISTFESFRSSAYQDEKSLWTIGYHTIIIDGRGVCATDTCTKEQALVWLKSRIEVDYQSIEIFCKQNEVVLTDAQCASLLSFCYSCGVNAFFSSSIVKDLMGHNPFDVEKVARDLMLWKKVQISNELVVSQGLENRRDKEALIFEGKDPNKILNAAPLKIQSQIQAQSESKMA